MLRGMTAYSRSSKEGYLLELHTVNKRHLEIRCNVPTGARSLEGGIRKALADQIGRGQVTCSLSSVGGGSLNQLKEFIDEMSSTLEVAREACVDAALRSQGITEELDETLVHGLLQEALVALIVSKEEEGRLVEQDICGRLGQIEEAVGVIEGQTGTATESYRQKLIERIAEVTGGTDDERILKEVALYAERVDITEELVRLRHHLSEMRKLLESKSLVSAKRLEFLLQEISREVNTSASKSSNAMISQQVVTIKSELEKIKEQLANVE